MAISINRIKHALRALIECKSPLINYTKIGQTSNPFTIYMKYNHVTIQEAVIYLLNNKKSITRILMNILGLTLKDIFTNELFEPTEFNIFGCQLSADVDVAIKVPYIMDSGFLILDKIKGQLLELGHIDKEIDYVQVVVDRSNNIALTNKGTKELQNMIYYTYELHKQICQPIFTNPIIHIDPFTKIASVNKHVIDNIDYYYTNHASSAKEIRIIFYQTLATKVSFINNILSKFVIHHFDNNVKALVVKLCQAIIINNNDNEMIPEMYSKLNLAKCFSQKYDIPYELLILLLTRGTICINMSQYDDIFIETQKIFTKILNIYISICDNINDYFDLSLIVPFNYKNTGNVLFDEFVVSPLTPTQIFIDYYKIYYNNDITQLLTGNSDDDFYMLYSNYQDVKEYLIIDFVENHVELCNQRSLEWKKKMEYYQCGNDIGINSFIGETIDDFVHTYYNLYRGAISENLVTKFCDFSSFLKIDVVPFVCGLIVESKNKMPKVMHLIYY